jgi:thermitase
LATDDPYSNIQWGLTAIHAPTSWWQAVPSGRSVTIAILDTGIDANHEDLQGKLISEVNLTDSSTPGDIYGHGTAVAGIITADCDNGKGIAGLAPNSRLMNIKVANDYGLVTAEDVAKGIVWAVDHGANIINISLEIRKSSPELESAVEYAWNRGLLIIAAAGNDGSGIEIFPAYYDKCIAVAAISPDMTLAPLSNHSSWVDVAAPGFNIYTTLPSNRYGYESGTSFAAAYVSGLAALVYARISDLNGDGKLNDEVKAAIEAGSRNIGVSGIGNGLIDINKSLYTE